MAAQFNFKKRGGQRCVLDIVNRPGNQLLTGAGFAEDQHARICGRNDEYQFQSVFQGSAISDDCSALSANFVFEIESLSGFFVVILPRFLVLQRFSTAMVT